MIRATPAKYSVTSVQRTAPWHGKATAPLYSRALDVLSLMLGAREEPAAPRLDLEQSGLPQGPKLGSEVG